MSIEDTIREMHESEGRSVSDVVAEAKAALEGVTKGPWSVSTESCDCGNGYGCSHGTYPYAIRGPRNLDAEGATSETMRSAYGREFTEVSTLTDEDAAFIAASRHLVPALIAEIERLRADRTNALDAIAQEYDRVEDRMLSPDNSPAETSRHANTMAGLKFAFDAVNQ